MDKQAVKKISTLSFLGSALVTYMTVNVLFKALAGVWGPASRVYSNDAFAHGLPLVAALAVFFVLQMTPGILSWSEEVILEVSKVVWPSRKDTVAMTIVVMVFVAIASFLLIIIDFLARHLIQLIIQ